MLAVSIIFFFVVSAALTPLIVATHDSIIFKIGNSKIGIRKKRVFRLIILIICLLITLPSIFAVMCLANFICTTELGCYIAVLVYTLLFSILSSSKIYLSPDIKVDTAFKAFKKGFTVSSIRHIFSILYLRVIIEVAYLVILILAQIEELGFCAFPKEVSLFFTLNKYGIVIMVAVEKIIKSIAPERERRKILSDTFVEQEKKEEKEREEMRRSFKEIWVAIKQSRQERKAKRRQSKEWDNK